MLKSSNSKALPREGSVGGIDVGWSERRASSAVARLSWDEQSVSVSVKRFRAIDPERSTAILESLSDRVSYVAIDGPLCTGLLPGKNYRFAERMLTLGFQPLIGKPGQTNSPNGQLLNKHATMCAHIVVGSRLVDEAVHEEKVHTLAIVESFPTSFLGVLLNDPTGLKTKREASSDVFYRTLSNNGALEKLLLSLLPGRRPTFHFQDVRNHDDRAAIVCALTALCVAAGTYTAVGDTDGWIILPPHDSIQPWAHEILAQNSARLAAAGISPRLGLKLGLLSGMYPDMPLAEFNASDEIIAASFHNERIFPDCGR